MPKSLPLALSLSGLLVLGLTGCAEQLPIRTGPLQAPQVTAMLLPPPHPEPAVDQEQAEVDPEDAECLAQAIYFEARGEQDAGKRAVAAVVLNRVAQPEFPDTVCGVVRDGGERPPCQFSWWCDGKSDAPTDEVAWSEALSVANEALQGLENDPTEGALFFHHTSVRPGWRRVFQRTVRIGPHIFYRVPQEADTGGEGG